MSGLHRLGLRPTGRERPLGRSAPPPLAPDMDAGLCRVAAAGTRFLQRGANAPAQSISTALEGVAGMSGCR